VNTGISDMRGTVAVVTGAAGEVGKAFLDCFLAEEIECRGITHQDVNLADAVETENVLGSLGLGAYECIILVHTVGRFKWEGNGIPCGDADGDGISDEIFESNVLTFKHVVQHLISLEKHLTICNIGSISDRYGIPWWRSYSRAKNLVREQMRELAKRKAVRGISVNVSTVQTTKECQLRPCADQRFWLSPDEMAKKAMPYIMRGPDGYLEIDIFKDRPDFDPLAYYLDPALIKQRWLKEMGQ